MEYVLYQSANSTGVVYLMDEESASNLVVYHAEQDNRAATGNYYGADELDYEIDAIWEGATVLEQTRDKRAIAALKQNYKEVC